LFHIPSTPDLATPVSRGSTHLPQINVAKHRLKKILAVRQHSRIAGLGAASDNLENCAVLSEAFYQEIDQHRIPVEREVVAALAIAPSVLGLYLWLVWKPWSLNSDSARIPLFAAGGLANQLDSIGYSPDRFFRRKLTCWLAEVKAFWPQCPAQISPDGHTLIVRSSKKSPAFPQP
jgi:hypothetical protein